MIESPAKMRDFSAPLGGDELAEGMMLVRASTLKVIRFQLAMAREDRRGALQAVDDLVALDRRLQEYLGNVRAGECQLLFRNELDAERAMLDREKLTLVAGVIRRPPQPEAPTPQAADDDWLGPCDLPEQYEEPPRRLRWWMAAVPAAASAFAAAIYFAGTPELQAWYAAAVGVLQ